MKLFFCFFLFIVWCEAFAQAPKVQGQSSSSGVYSPNIKLPHHQATKLSGTTSLLETGNNNRLINPGFEHSTVATGWSTSVTSTATATIAAEATSPFTEGAQSGRFTCVGGASGGTCLFYQDVATSEIQGMVRALLQSDTALGVKFYSRVNGANNLYRDIISTGKGPVHIPQTMGSTSTGIAIEITVAASQTIIVYADDMFVGVEKVVADAQKIQTQSSYLSVGAFNAPVTGALTSSVGSGLYTYDSGTGIYTASTTINIVLSYTTRANGAATVEGQIQVPSGTTLQRCNTQNSTGYNCTASYTQTISSGTTFRFVSNGASSANEISVSATKVDNTQNYSTPSSDTSLASCGHTTSDFTGFGTVSNIETQCYRDGEHLVMTGKFTSGTSTATEARVNLKLGGVALTSAGTTKIPSIRVEGHGAISAGAANSYEVLIESSKTYVTFGIQSGSRSGLTKVNGDNIVTSGQLFSFFTRVPINGWENYKDIIGDFKEMMKVPGVSRPKTCYYKFGGASATLTSPTECTTGTCVEVYDSCGTVTPPTYGSVSFYRNITFASGTWVNSSPLDCSCVAYDVTAAQRHQCSLYFDTGDNTWASDSSGGAILNLHVTDQAGSTEKTAYVNVKCEGQAP